MCEARVTGIIPGWAAGRTQRRQPACDGSCRQQKTLTDELWPVAKVVIGIVLLASAGTILHVLAVGLEVIAIITGVLLAVAVAGGCWWLARRVRSLRQPVILPLPDVAVRTVVTGVQVRALGTGARQQQQLPQRQPGQPAPSSARR